MQKRGALLRRSRNKRKEKDITSLRIRNSGLNRFYFEKAYYLIWESIILDYVSLVKKKKTGRDRGNYINYKNSINKCQML